MRSSRTVWTDLLVWHVGVSFARFPVGILLLVLSVLYQRRAITFFDSQDFSHIDRAREAFRTASLCITVPNDLFLLTFDCSRASTITGTVLSQQLLLLVSAAFGLAALCLLAQPEAHYEYYLDMFFGLYLALGMCTTASLFVPLSALRASKYHETRSPWLLNTKDLLAGETEYATSLTFLGVNRRPDSYVFSISATIYGAQAARRIELSFFRRVSPVETKRYALLRNVAALVAILILIIRAVILLAQAQGEVFQTITRTEPCSWLNVTRSNVQIIVKHSDTDGSLTWPDVGYIMDISVSERTYKQGAGNYWQNAGVCSSQTYPVPARNVNSTIGEPTTQYDTFDVFTCTTKSDANVLNARYNVNIRASINSSLDGLILPNLWLNFGSPDELLPRKNMTVMPAMTPWLVPSWQLTAGIQSTAEMSMARRRLIDSPFLRDTLGGMKPEYMDITLFPITTLRETPLVNLSIASGSIIPSSRIQFTSTNTRQNIENLRSQHGSLPQTCEVIEDYRASTAFDAVSSIGGLLAILQGLHILLFGRPMFWGIFGAKLITPFGLLGNWSSSGLRQRLRDYYDSKAELQEVEEFTKSDTIRLQAFLRDYVIDFGPADSPREMDK